MDQPDNYSRQKKIGGGYMAKVSLGITLRNYSIQIIEIIKKELFT